MTRWLSDTRYYSAVLERDLLGDWTVHIAHGGRRNRLGSVRTHVVHDQAEGEQFIASIHKVRVRHGYHLASEGS